MVILFDVGSRIRALRTAKNISAKEIAISLGVSPSFISGIEKNTNKCSLENLERICAVLGITLSEFFAEVEQPIDHELLKLIDSAKKLTPEQRSSLQKLLETMSSD